MSTAATGATASGTPDGISAHAHEELPIIDFATFVVSLSHSALMHMGHAPHPETEKIEIHVELAKQTIDLIGLLEQKTKGNLTGDEERLLGQVLYELRTKYVDLQKSR